jgi:hypothetical protein
MDRKHTDPKDNKMYDGYSEYDLTFIPSNKLSLTRIDASVPYEIYVHEKKKIKYDDKEAYIGEETRFFGIIYFAQSEVIELMLEPTYDKFIELIGERGNYEEIFKDKGIDKCLF